MGGHTFPEVDCAICAKAVDLSMELCADEYGKAVHEDCYVKHITGFPNNPADSMTAD